MHKGFHSGASVARQETDSGGNRARFASSLYVTTLNLGSANVTVHSRRAVLTGRYEVSDEEH